MKIQKSVLTSLFIVAVAALPLGLTACDKTVSSSKESTVKTKESPEGNVKTTETTTKTVVKEPPK